MKIPHKCGKKILRKMVKSKENQESRKIISTIQETKENRCKTQKDEDWFEPRRKCSSRGQELSKTRNGRGQKPLCRQVKIQAWTKVPCLEMKIQAWTGPTKHQEGGQGRKKRGPNKGPDTENQKPIRSIVSLFVHMNSNSRVQAGIFIKMLAKHSLNALNHRINIPSLEALMPRRVGRVQQGTMDIFSLSQNDQVVYDFGSFSDNEHSQKH